MRLAVFAFALAALVPAAALSAQSRPALDDAAIASIFDLANTADIEMGELAAKQGQSQEVKDMGRNFAAAHTGVRQQGRDLAKKLGLKLAPPVDGQMAKDHVAALARLRGLKGAAFDKAYVAHEVAYHQAVIDAVTKTLLPATKNAELKALIEQVAPAFVAHLEGAKALQARLN
jgi:putative membrane protein